MFCSPTYKFFVLFSTASLIPFPARFRLSVCKHIYEIYIFTAILYYQSTFLSTHFTQKLKINFYFFVKKLNTQTAKGRKAKKRNFLVQREQTKSPLSSPIHNIISGLLTYVKTFDLILRIIIFDMGYVDVIRQLMLDKGLSQQKLANELGVNQTTVSQWLLGKKKPGFDSIMLLYEKFGIEPNLLFGIE